LKKRSLTDKKKKQLSLFHKFLSVDTKRFNVLNQLLEC